MDTGRNAIPAHPGPLKVQIVYAGSGALGALSTRDIR
jgi:hypothetical protein